MSQAVGPDLQRLLQLARRHDSAARGQLLELYRNYLTLLARVQISRRLRGKVEPADLVQEAFLEAHRDFDHFRGTTEAALVAWLRQILARTLTDVVRRYFGAQQRNVRLERQLADELDQSSRALDMGLLAKQSTPSQHAVRREQAVLLADALRQLPTDYAEAVVLRHMEGLSFPEIALRMGRSQDSVEKLWMRGIARLRRLVGGAS
jgi:RNA polymerase sigma-70 factor (ECF subfamily)